MLLEDENATEFAAFEAAVRAELAPEGMLEADLVGRIIMAAWRARQADRLEAALLGQHLAAADGGADAAEGAAVATSGWPA